MVCFVIFVHMRGMRLVEQGFPCFVRWQAGEFVWRDIGSLSCRSVDGMPSLSRAILHGTCFLYGS